HYSYILRENFDKTADDFENIGGESEKDRIFWGKRSDLSKQKIGSFQWFAPVFSFSAPISSFFQAIIRIP
ncbi:MAG: hypothetical protein UHN41_04945, partial [Bacteroidales bacterium]|nr:hypothetical protein [Bacteroidales bacterium]